jgi:sulfur relay (sulfurtransferase) DsrC/TusE family protein
MRYIITESQYRLIKEQNLLKDLSSLSLDDTIDYISAAIDVVPGIGNLVSAGIDLSHALSYVVRFFHSTSDESKVEYAVLALLTFGTAFIPFGGNAIPIMARKGVKGILNLTPAEIMMMGQKLGVVDKTKFFLSKKTWKYNLLLALAKIMRSELTEFLIAIGKKLTEVYNKIKNIPSLKNVAMTVMNLIKVVDELRSDADLAVRLLSGK